MTRIAVIDIGKTNAKLALVEGETLAEIAVVTRPNRVLPGPPWPHFDLAGHRDFFLHHLSAFHAAHGIDAISVTTHGASAVLLDARGELAAPMLDYEHPGPDELAAAYDAIRPDFDRTGSPRLPGGLNVGAQLHWMLDRDPDLDGRLAQVVTYPQYWGHLLTGELATDVTSLGCHTDLWDPWRGRFSDLVERLGLGGRIAPARRADEVLGRLRPELAARTGLASATPVAVGIHDSNASLYPYLSGRAGAFSVVSTGTWVVSMAVAGRQDRPDPSRDVLVNVNALGQPVPSARFMGGREYEVMGGDLGHPPDTADRQAVLRKSAMILPSVGPGSGPFPDRRMRWLSRPEGSGERRAAISWYLALMTRTCLDLAGADGPVIIEGPFAQNADYCAMLASISPAGAEIAGSATGTSAGAALLCTRAKLLPWTQAVPADADLADYAARWRAEVQNSG